MIVLTARVVPWMKYWISCGFIDLSLNSVVSSLRIACSGRSGTEGVFKTLMRPVSSSSREKSVNVPPISISQAIGPHKLPLLYHQPKSKYPLHQENEESNDRDLQGSSGGDRRIGLPMDLREDVDGQGSNVRSRQKQRQVNVAEGDDEGKYRTRNENFERSKGRVTLQNACTGVAPRLRAASSSRGSTPERPAVTLRMT